MKVEPIGVKQGKRFIAEYHYAIVCPPITKLCLGLFENGKLVGVALLGYGVRPKHTLKKLFPSLEVPEYLELNRLCVLDEMPRNTETRFLGMMARSIQEARPDVKVYLVRVLHHGGWRGDPPKASHYPLWNPEEVGHA